MPLFSIYGVRQSFLLQHGMKINFNVAYRTCILFCVGLTDCYATFLLQRRTASTYTYTKIRVLHYIFRSDKQQPNTEDVGSIPTLRILWNSSIVALCTSSVSTKIPPRTKRERLPKRPKTKFCKSTIRGHCWGPWESQSTLPYGWSCEEIQRYGCNQASQISVVFITLRP